MRIRSILASILLLAGTTVAGTAAAVEDAMVAGWDFSQYYGSTYLVTSGLDFTNVLDANYSDLDPTFGAGAESAAFGTMYMDGSFGSTNVNAGSGSEPFVPFSGSLGSNIGAPALVDFDAHTVLASEGQEYTQFLSMTARDAVTVVFSADLSTVSDLGSNWNLSFGGKTLSGTSSIGIEFSSDGTDFTGFGSVNLDTSDKLYSVDLGTGASDLAYVRLSFSVSGADQPLIDNLAIRSDLAPVPEPGTAALVLGGLLGLGVVGRRRG